MKRINMKKLQKS